ncbi:MAG: DUF4097 family beta strand repeat-containing protein [Clostridia bacterium]|jgi:hypothetical protein|nr:DUF4097 family beta strand repeat-containing protein [Clostridia bacterium]HQO68773.1 DUF4097 family beta strand repeat-containing protein [Clostridia bacterium]
MSRTLKALVIGGIFIVLGLLTFLVGYYFNSYRLDNIFEYEVEEKDPLSLKSYDALYPDSITMISIMTKRMPVTIESHDEGYIRLAYYENQDQSFEITESNGKLYLKKIDLGFFEENVSSNLRSLLIKNKEDNGVTIYIPSSYMGELLISTTLRDISVVNPLAFSKIKKIDFKNSYADINMNSVSGNILNLKNTGGRIDCSDMDFNDITVISTNADVRLDYLSSDKTEFLINKSSVEATNIISDDIRIESVSSQIRIGISAYSVQYSVEIEKSEKSEINLGQNIVDTLDKKIYIKAADSNIKIAFSLD